MGSVLGQILGSLLGGNEPTGPTVGQNVSGSTIGRVLNKPQSTGVGVFGNASKGGSKGPSPISGTAPTNTDQLAEVFKLLQQVR